MLTETTIPPPHTHNVFVPIKCKWNPSGPSDTNKFKSIYTEDRTHTRKDSPQLGLAALPQLSMNFKDSRFLCMRVLLACVSAHHEPVWSLSKPEPWIPFSVPFLRTPNSCNAELENSMSPGLFLSLLSGRQAGQGRMGTLEEFLFPFAFFRCYFPKRLHWLASTSASVTKSWRSDTVNREGHKIKSQGHSLRSCNFTWEEPHSEAWITSCNSIF